MAPPWFQAAGCLVYVMSSFSEPLGRPKMSFQFRQPSRATVLLLLLVFLLGQGTSVLAMAHGHSGGGHSAHGLAEMMDHPAHEAEALLSQEHQAHSSHHSSHHPAPLDNALDQPGPDSADGDCCQPDCECIAGHCSSAGAVAWLNASTQDLPSSQVPRSSSATLQATPSNPFRPPIPA